MRFAESDVRRNCINNVTISDEVKNGIDADLIIIPVIQPQSVLGPNTLASAGACFLNGGADKRPILGIVNVGSVYNFSKFDSEPESITLFFHELTHVLGFSPFLWPHFLTQPEVKTFFQDGKKLTR